MLFNRLVAVGIKQRKQQVSRRGYGVLPQYIDNCTPTKVSHLPSGLRVATQTSASQTATVGVWISAGSASETEENNGVSNLFQHLAYKGTASRPRDRLAYEVESVGARLSSYTSREQTSFSADISPQDLSKILPILGDVVQNTTFQPDSFEKARQEVLREEKQFRNNIDDVLFDHLHTCAYQTSSLRLAVTGEPKIVKKLKDSDVASFVEKNYTGNNMVVVATGAVNHNEVLDVVGKVFGNLPKTQESKLKDEFVDWVGSEVRIRDDSSHSIHAFFSFEAVGWNHPHYWTCLILQSLIGSWDRFSGAGNYLSSRLSETVSSEHLGDSFQAFYTAYQNTGVFGVHATGSNEKFDDYAYEIISEFQKIAAFLSPQELAQAKAKVKRSFLSQLRSHAAVAEDIGRSLLVSNRHISLPEICTRIDAIDASDVYDLLKVYFEDVDPVVTVQGFTELFPDYHYVRSWTYWNRW